MRSNGRFRYSSKPGTNVLDYGADNSGVSDSTAAFNHAAASCAPGYEVTVPDGQYKIAQTTIADVVKLRPGVTLAGTRAAYILPTGANCPCIVAVDAPGAGVRGLTILKDGAMPSWSHTRILTVDGTTSVSSQTAYNAWSAAGQFDCTNPNLCRPAVDTACAILIGGSDFFTVDGTAFGSNGSDELSFWNGCVFIDSNPDNTQLTGVTVKNVLFDKATFGLISPGASNMTFTDNSWTGVHWNYDNGVSGGGAGHMVYMTAANGVLASQKNNVFARLTDTSTLWQNLVADMNGTYFEPSIKLHNQYGSSVTNCTLHRDTGGFDVHDFKDCTVSGLDIDMSTAPPVGVCTFGDSIGFRIDQGTYPTDLTYADFGGNTWDSITFKDVPDSVLLGDCYVRSFMLNGYDGPNTVPIHVGDAFTNLVIYLRTADQSSANLGTNRLIQKGGAVGTVDAPVYIGRLPGTTSWASDQQVATLHYYCQTTDFFIAVDSGAGHYVAGHPPVVNAYSACGTGNNLNGSPIAANGSVSFTTAVSPPA